MASFTITLVCKEAQTLHAGLACQHSLCERRLSYKVAAPPGLLERNRSVKKGTAQRFRFGKIEQHCDGAGKWHCKDFC